MAEHTPGPWHVEGSLVFDNHGNIIVYPMLGYDNKVLARDQANASFIASAPDMERALEEVLCWAVQSIPREVEALAFAALAKAKGE